MSFDSIEVSEYFEPQELFKFSRGTKDWLYTSADTDITLGADTFLAEPISRSKIQSTSDINQSSIKIKASRRNSFAAAFLSTVPTDVISITITRFHAAGVTSAVIFKGRVLNVSYEGNMVVITCQQNLSLLKNPGLRRLYQTTCPHVLYGGYCKVVKVDQAISGVLATVTGVTLTSSAFTISVNPAFDATWLQGGIIEHNDNGIISKRFITEHNNSAGSIVLNLPLANAAAGVPITVYPGCDRNTTTCLGKFSNIENYGGFPFIPQKNPMDGTSIY